MIVTLDFETFFSKDYTLSKLSTEEYVRSPLFEPMGCAVRTPDGTVDYVVPLSLKKFFDRVDWSRTAILCHHAQFDGLILSHYYRVKPRVWLDTLSMARLVHGIHHSNGLDALAKRYGMPAKSVPYNAFKGLHWDELPGLTQQQLAEGGMHDVRLTYELFTRMAPLVPDEELRLIDLTIRMYTEPLLRGDIDALKKVELAEIVRKQELRSKIGVSPAELQSPERFAELLRECGLDPPKKQTKSGWTYCFAKTDKFMQEVVLEHPTAGPFGEARLGVRSTIEQSRAERLSGMAQRGPLPVYLAYCGAHTTRWSGGDRVNWQNFKRGSPIRAAIRAPSGWKIVKCDKSQIECRFLNYLAHQDDVVETFRRGDDPYVGIASLAYGERVYKAKPDDPRYEEMLQKRGTGKQLELSCGYGAGAKTIQLTAAKGTYGPPVTIDIETAESWKKLYRQRHPKVVDFWYQAEQVLYAMSQKLDYTWGIFKTRGTSLMLPNGTALQYPDLERVYDERIQNHAWVYKSRYGARRIWGGFLVENVIQATSRVDIGQCMLRLTDLGYRIVLMEHDALAVLVRSEAAEAEADVIREVMRTPPSWCEDIPLDAEASVGEGYA